MTIALNLVVLRCSDLPQAVDFYSCLGLKFTQHRHGKGLEHFAAEMEGCVFELYPQTADGPSTLGTRIGFRVPSIAETVTALSDFPDAIIAPPSESEWGLRAVISDPAGHRIELLQMH